jgi:hypothetical protein
VRDLLLSLSGQLSVAYGAVFVVGAVGLTISWWALNQIDIKAYQSEQLIESSAILAASMD